MSLVIVTECSLKGQTLYPALCFTVYLVSPRSCRHWLTCTSVKYCFPPPSFHTLLSEKEEIPMVGVGRIILWVLCFLRFFVIGEQAGGGGCIFDVLRILFETTVLNADLQFLSWTLSSLPFPPPAPLLIFLFSSLNCSSDYISTTQFPALPFNVKHHNKHTCSCDLESVNLLHGWATMAFWQGRLAECLARGR